MSSCPTCGEMCPVSRPAEPDVGIMSETWACREHGEFFVDHDGKKVFCEEEPAPLATMPEGEK